MIKKVLITGGHLTPALSVIEELQKRGWKIIFIGRKYASEEEKVLSVEAKIIPQMGIETYFLNAGRVRRIFNLKTIISFLKIPLGFFQALYYVGKTKPAVILSFGGYLSVPVVFAGWLWRIPTITHEQTTVKGLATKFNSLFAKKIAVSWKKNLKDFPSGKVVLTGNPLRKNIFNVDEKYWRSLGFSKNLPLIFITGGNQGSRAINQAVREIVPFLVKKFNVFHQCGHLILPREIQLLRKAKESLPKNLRKRYVFEKYLTTTQMGTLLNKASLIISRAGANTISELAILGKPCLLIPYPWLYQNEQMKNALMLKRVGLGEVLPQKKLTSERLLKSILKMFENISSYRKNAKKAKKLIVLDAGKKIADLVEEIFQNS